MDLKVCSFNVMKHFSDLYQIFSIDKLNGIEKVLVVHIQ